MSVKRIIRVKEFEQIDDWSYLQTDQDDFYNISTAALPGNTIQPGDTLEMEAENGFTVVYQEGGLIEVPVFGGLTKITRMRKAE